MSTEPVPTPAEPRPPTQAVGPGTIAYRVALLFLLAIIAWCLVGIRANTQTARNLESFARWSQDGKLNQLSPQTKVVPVYIVNGHPSSQVEGFPPDTQGSQINSLKIDSNPAINVKVTQ